MKVKKLLISVALVAIMIAMAISSNVYAKTSINVIFKEMKIASGVNGTNYGINGNGIGNATTITRLGKRNSSGLCTYNYNLYCGYSDYGYESSNRNVYKANQEFGYIEGENHSVFFDQYDSKYNMNDSTDQQTIINNKKLLIGGSYQPLYTSETYYKILALADLFYVGNPDDEDEFRAFIEPLVDEGIIQFSSTNYTYDQLKNANSLITPEQVKATQQAALWYFSNGMEIQTGDNFLYKNVEWPVNYTSLNTGNDGDSSTRQDIEARKLYDYLISKANELGTDGYETTNKVYLYLDDSQDEDEQPIIEIEKENKEFDLALRKYISSVKDKNGNDVTIASRKPNTSYETKLDLTGEETAKKVHTKDPIKVKKGYTVVYTIRVYNEGEVDGYAKEVTDYLPEGLSLKQESSINTQYGWSSTDGKTIKTSYLSDKKLTAANRVWASFNEDDANGKYYRDLLIECVVNDNAKTNNLKNIAEITDSEGEHGETDVDSNIGNVETDTDDYNPTYPTTGRGEEDDDDFEDLRLDFDLALRKYITKVEDRNGNVIKSATDLIGRNPNRENGIDESTIDTKTGITTPTTATYKHRKDPVSVQTGYYVYYTLSVYNEGEVDGYAKEIKDQLPEGLTFVSVVSGDFAQDGTVGSDNVLTLKRTKSGTQKSYATGKLVDYSESVVIKCKVTGTVSNKILTNLAWISSYYNSDDNTTVTVDLDSHSTQPTVKPSKSELVTDTVGYINEDKNNNKELDNSSNYFDGQEDDDDFEKIIIENFDLALRKFITVIKSEDSTQVITDRVPDITGENVVTDTETSETEDTTAQKQHPKNALEVLKGDTVIYSIRVYNEGYVDGYAAEVTDYLPEGLSFKNYVPGDRSLNDQYNWTVSEDGRTVTTDFLKGKVLTATNGDWTKFNEENAKGKYYIDLEIECVVNEEAEQNNLKNIAAITKYEYENGEEVTDVDSDKNPVNPEDYNPQNKEDGIGEQDDDDEENLKLVELDLALRKFITKVSTKEDMSDAEKYYTVDETTGKIKDGRVPKVSAEDILKLYNGEITTANYNHPKQPVVVKPGSYIEYTLRVYNEGSMDGYAREITDHLPEYLEFVDCDTNKEIYGWTVSEDGRTIKTNYLKDVKLNAVTSTVLDSTEKLITERENNELKVICKLKDKASEVIYHTNIAEITEYGNKYKNAISIDRDSQTIDNGKYNGLVDLPDDKDLPNYKDDEIASGKSYIPGQQDDDDFEKIYTPLFDLSLRKWVTQSILIDGDEESINNTGNQPFDDPEEPAKVELHRRKIDDVVVKFKYSIRVFNDGADENGNVKPGYIAGYAKEVKDHIPEGLKFVQEDNPDWTPIDEKTIVTNKLANTLLKPGEYADVEVILTWINGEDNLGLKVNDAEISKDDNEWDVPDVDSEPDNMYEKHEDDDDNAPVLLSVSTGEDKKIIMMIIGIGLTALVVLAGGIFLIKKYVL